MQILKKRGELESGRPFVQAISDGRQQYVPRTAVDYALAQNRV